MKYFIVADVHGFYDEMINALNGAGYEKDNPNHCFVSCGDLIDRGPDAAKCLKFVNSINKKRKILIKGNHEDLLQELLDGRELGGHDWSNGTINTLDQFAADLGIPACVVCMQIPIMGTKYQPWIKYYKSLVDYAEISDCIIVHGWIPYSNYNEDNCQVNDWKKGDWYSARWHNGMDCWGRGIKLKDKTIICGHWHCSWGWSHIRQKYEEFPPKNQLDALEKSFQPFIDEGIIALDSCVAYSHKINCVVIEK